MIFSYVFTYIYLVAGMADGNQSSARDRRTDSTQEETDRLSDVTSTHDVTLETVHRQPGIPLLFCPLPHYDVQYNYWLLILSE